MANASVRLIACRDARLVRPLHQPCYLLSILTERTHEPCVPTCRKAGNSFTRQLVYSSNALERTHEPCVPTYFKAGNSFTRQLVYSSNRIGADARAVRPYNASPTILPAKMIDFSDRPLADKRLSLRFRHAIMGESRDNLSHNRRFYTCPKPAYRVPSRFFQSSFV